MKRSLLHIFIYIFLFLIPFGQTAANTGDSIRFSLLTCSPGEEIYTLFGHTAVRYENPSLGVDIVFNYGLFSFNEPHFILRFSLGEANFQMGITDYKHFAAEYEYFGRSIWQQTLNLTNEEKTKLSHLLEVNYQPQNRTYHYNFFYDNCATRPRDKIEESIIGKIVYPPPPEDHSLSYRDIVHEYSKEHPWARFGMDLCIGSDADAPITRRQMMFAPFYLMNFFEKAQINDTQGQRPLVANTEKIVSANHEKHESSWLPTPLQCSLLLFIIVTIGTIYGIRRKKVLWGIDLILFSLAGIAGSILAFLAVFSQHPAVGSNYLLFIFHPGHILFIPYIIYCMQKRKECWYLTLNIIVLTLFIGLFPLIPQRFDFAVVPLALCLLIRSASYLVLTYKKK